MEEYCPRDDEKMILFQDDDTVVNEKDLEKFIINPGDSVSTPFCLGSWSIVNSPVIRHGDKKLSLINCCSKICPRFLKSPEENRLKFSNKKTWMEIRQRAYEGDFKGHLGALVKP